MKQRISYTVEAEVSVAPVDQVWMALVIQWLQAWRFTKAQADHLKVIIAAQTDER